MLGVAITVLGVAGPGPAGPAEGGGPPHQDQPGDHHQSAQGGPQGGQGHRETDSGGSQPFSTSGSEALLDWRPAFRYVP